MSLDPEAIRRDFPILDRHIDGTPLIYLDNAATTQTPEQVYNVFEDYYSRYNANVHRGIHTLSHEASVAYEEAHDRLADFVGATGGRAEMIFTKNATESINLVAYGYGIHRLGPGDRIVTTEMEHHASLVTWQQIAAQTGARLDVIRVTEDGKLDLSHAESLIGPDTSLVSVMHVSNVLGTVNPVEWIADLAHDHDAIVLVDGAQSVPNRPVDVESLGADFLAFSGHKMAGPTGIGCLYGKRELLESMEPFLFGGEMIRKVTVTDATWNELPWKFEAGTPPIAEAIALAEAAEYLEEIGMEQVQEHEDELAQYAVERLESREGIDIYGPPCGHERSGLVAFNVKGVHGHDLSSLLDGRGIAIRAGDHCTQPLHDVLEIPGSARASFYIYNTKDEIDQFVNALDQAPEELEPFLASDVFHERIYEHYRTPTNPPLQEPSFTKDAAETSCGDDGQFHVTVDETGTITELGFDSESCAVSTAVASLLVEELTGKHIETAANLDGLVTELLDQTFPPIRHDCVTGPEIVLREGAQEYLAGGAVNEDANEPAPHSSSS